MHTNAKMHLAAYALSGFLFGTIGLYMLAILSLMSQTFEMISGPFMAPGRLAAELAVGPNGSDAAVLALTLFNGVFYALLAVMFGIFFCGVLEGRKHK
jgi:hypothetical protein